MATRVVASFVSWFSQETPLSGLVPVIMTELVIHTFAIPSTSQVSSFSPSDVLAMQELQEDIQRQFPALNIETDPCNDDDAENMKIILVSSQVRSRTNQDIH